jgi:hypothetical protein
MHPRFPEALRMGDLSVQATKGPTIRVSVHSRLDPVELPLELFNVLPLFDGRPMRDALHQIEQQHGLKLRADLVSGLVDFQILQSADGLKYR